MKQKCYYFLLELKSAARRMLLLFLVFVISIALLFSALFMYNRASQNRESSAVITLGIVLPESDTVFKSIIGLANSLVSLRGFCRIESCNNEDILLEGLEDGTYNMGIVIPKEFYELANSMQSASFILYAPKNLTLSEKKLISLLQAVERVMIVTEGGIVGMYTGMQIYEFPISIGQMENDVTNLYVTSFLNRDNTYEEYFLSPYGDYSFMEYYLSSAFLIIVLIFSLSLIGLYDKYKLTFEKLYFKSIAQRLLCCSFKILSLSICFFAVLSTMLFLGNFICKIIGSRFIMLSPSAYLAAIVLSISLSSLFNLIGAIFVKAPEGKLVLMLLIIILMPVLSGGIIPVSFLPDSMQGAAHNLPFGLYHNLMLEALFGDISAVSVIKVIILTIIMLVVGFTIYIKRMAR